MDEIQSLRDENAFTIIRLQKADKKHRQKEKTGIAPV